jgi:hypothetical protein
MKKLQSIKWLRLLKLILFGICCLAMFFLTFFGAILGFGIIVMVIAAYSGIWDWRAWHTLGNNEKYIYMVIALLPSLFLSLNVGKLFAKHTSDWFYK